MTDQAADVARSLDDLVREARDTPARIPQFERGAANGPRFDPPASVGVKSTPQTGTDPPINASSSRQTGGAHLALVPGRSDGCRYANVLQTCPHLRQPAPFLRQSGGFDGVHLSACHETTFDRFFSCFSGWPVQQSDHLPTLRKG